MTKAHDFKRAVRARMAKTGERYTTARARILEQRSPNNADYYPVRHTGYPYRPGVCRDTGALRNWLRASGIVIEGTGEPLSETLLTGLAGGVGFLYVVFEYAGTPPLLSILTRFDSAADRFAIGGLERLALPLESSETSSAKKARAELDAALEAGRPALCVVDAVALRQTTAPALMRGMAPTLAVAVGREGEHLLVDVGSEVPLRMTDDAFADARAAFKKGKHRMITVAPDQPIEGLAIGIHEAIAACADRYTNSPYKGFASNFGLAGMAKWAELLVDEKNKKGWPTLFPEGRLACLALRRTFQGLEYEMTPPSAGRALYADFLREAAELTGRTAYAKAAKHYDAAAASWEALATSIAACGVPEVQTGCEFLDIYSEMLDAQAEEAERTSIAVKLSNSADGSQLSRAAALTLYRELAQGVRAALEAEKSALSALIDATKLTS